jgi:hypothetical protein
MGLFGSGSGTPSIQDCLVGIPFPIAKNDLLERLAMNGATDLLLGPIRNASATRFSSPQEVIETIRAS